MSRMLGTLLPMTALRSGDKSLNYFEMGSGFIDWLARTKQQAWQLLPLHQTNWLGADLLASPFSGYGVGLNPGLLSGSKLKKKLPKATRGWLKKNRYWLEDYGLFLALAEHFQTDDWTRWPAAIRKARPAAVVLWRRKLEERVRFFEDQQFLLHKEYGRMRSIARKKRIKLIGELPFYLGKNSPLVWKYQKCMGISSKGEMPYISGCRVGKLFGRQEWGHPVYDWLGEEKRRKLMELWKLRLKYAASIYDWVRIDAGVRFFEFEKLRVGDPKGDRIVRGLGEKVLAELVKYVRRLRLRVFVEDISDFDMSELRRVMRKLRVPGVWVLALELVGKEEEWSEDFFDVKKLRANRVHYSSNHDSLPLVGWLEAMADSERRAVGKVVGVTGTTAVKKLAEGVREYLMSNCRMLVLPLQDWLLTSERINIPGTVGKHNWSYRMPGVVEELGSV